MLSRIFDGMGLYFHIVPIRETTAYHWVGFKAGCCLSARKFVFDIIAGGMMVLDFWGEIGYIYIRCRGEVPRRFFMPANSSCLRTCFTLGLSG